MTKKYKIIKSEHLDRKRRAEQAIHLKRKFRTKVESDHVAMLEVYKDFHPVKKKYVAQRLSIWLKVTGNKKEDIFKSECFHSRNEAPSEMTHFKSQFLVELIQYAEAQSVETLSEEMRKPAFKIQQLQTYSQYFIDK